MGDDGTALLVVIIASIATLAASAITKLGDAWIKHRERQAARDEERLTIGEELRQIAQYGTHLQSTDLEDAARMLQENSGRLRQRAKWLYGRRAAELIIRIHAWINTARNWHAGAQKRNDDEHWTKSQSAIRHLWKTGRLRWVRTLGNSRPSRDQACIQECRLCAPGVVDSAQGLARPLQGTNTRSRGI